MQKFPGIDAPAILKADIAFVGQALDDRGEAAIQFAKQNANSSLSYEYDPKTMELMIDGHRIIADYLADNMPDVAQKSVLVEATTLGLPELYLILRALKACFVGSVNIIYVEPEEYRRTAHAPDSSGNFELSEAILGYRPIPGAIIDLNSRRLKRGVFFLGYEGERLERVFEDQQMIRSDDVSVVFGVPAYQVGWEMDAILNNLETIKVKSLGHDIQYCPADNPSAAFDLVQLIFDSLDTDEQMFIAPIGTKPCGIGAALFAVQHTGKVGLLYDHPRRGTKRTSKINAWHIYNITFG